MSPNTPAQPDDSTPTQENTLHTHEWQLGTSLGPLTVTLITDEILRVALTPVGAPPHQTWAVAPEAVTLSPSQVAVAHLTDALVARTPTLTVTMHENDLRLDVRRADGSVVLADAPDHAWSATPEGLLRWDVALADGERIFGGGQRTGPLDKHGRALTFWNTDPLPNHNDETDGMYQSVPFLIGLHAGKAFGVFYDTNWQAAADIGRSDPARLSYTTTGPDLVAFIFAGPTLADVMSQYTSITGRMPPQPRWSLGNQQSRWSYMNADEVRGIAAAFREHQIPCDAIYLDIDYMRGYRDFTWDPQRFPDPAGLVSELREQGFRVVPIIDPGVKIDMDYATYREGMEHGYFVRNADGSVFEGWVWPGHCVWTDFARADALAWWGEQHRPLLESGIAGIWNDMNEPSQAAMSAPAEVTVPFGATLPLDAQHGTAAAPLSHAAFHNAYGDEMNRATRTAIAQSRPDERAFVLTRAAGAGGQRAAIVWNGDNSSQWDHVKLAVTMNLGVGLSGYPVTGFDIGGFWGDTEPELLVRFTQIGAFMPFCRNHSAVGTNHQEPWVFGEPYTSACRAAITRRYELLPLLTTLFHEASVTGAPIVRPLAWIAPDDAACAGCDDEFLLGDDLLVAPVLTAGATSRDVLLPPGQWFDWTTGAIHQGGQRVGVPVTLATMPIFTRAGTILPKAGIVQHTDEAPSAPLTLHVHLTRAAPTAATTIWDDDDHPQAEARGTFARYQVTATWSGDAVTVHVEQAGGQMPPRYPSVRVDLHLPPDVTATPVGATVGSLAELPLTFRFQVADK